MILNYPARRRLIIILIVPGNLGLVSTASTLIVSFVGGEQTASAVSPHALLFIGSLPSDFRQIMLPGIYRGGEFLSGPFMGSGLILPGDIQTCNGNDAVHDELSGAPLNASSTLAAIRPPAIYGRPGLDGPRPTS